MLPLALSSLPGDAASLRDALEESLRRFVTATGPMVSVQDRNYPALAAIRFALDDAILADQPPQRNAPIGPVAPAFTVEHFEINGARVRVQGAAINLHCRAKNVALGQSRDTSGNLILLLQRAEEGSIEVSISVADLESMVRTGAKAAAAQQGVTVDDVRIDLRSRGERALDVTAHVRAKKLFLNATVRISGSAMIDEQLTMRLSGLACSGEGALGSLACGLLTPHLDRFNGREFSLLAFSLGEVRLRDVRVVAGKDLQVTAQFEQRPA